MTATATATEINPIQFYMADGKTALVTKIRQKINHVRGRAKTWDGTQAEYQEWAEANVEAFLRNVIVWSQRAAK